MLNIRWTLCDKCGKYVWTDEIKVWIAYESKCIEWSLYLYKNIKSIKVCICTCFQVDDTVQKLEKNCEISEQEENDVVPELGSNEDHAVYRRLSGGPKRAPPLGMLHKQVSFLTVLNLLKYDFTIFQLSICPHMHPGLHY